MLTPPLAVSQELLAVRVKARAELDTDPGSELSWRRSFQALGHPAISVLSLALGHNATRSRYLGADTLSLPLSSSLDAFSFDARLIFALL